MQEQVLNTVSILNAQANSNSNSTAKIKHVVLILLKCKYHLPKSLFD